MKILGMPVAVVIGLLMGTSLNAQHAAVTAARPAGGSFSKGSTGSASSANSTGSTSSAERQGGGPKPAASTPASASAGVAKPVQRTAGVKGQELHPRPILRNTAYWRNFCLYNPYAAVCGPEFVARESAPAAVTPTAIVNPYAAPAERADPKMIAVSQRLASPTILAAPAKPIVKVSDELAAGVTIGASQAEIRQMLGEPHTRISGGMDRYTYYLQSGGSLKLDFEDGHVTQVRKVED